MSRAFDDIPTLRSTPTQSPSSRMRRKSFARRLERCCCQSITYFPLLFVHGVTGWAVWVAVNVALLQGSSVVAYAQASLVTLVYLLANVSYLVAVFTSPGSPLDERIDLSQRYGTRATSGYEGLPTYERPDRGSHFDSAQYGPMTTVTAKSSGQPRYCKKCKTVKPDRAHHCSTCGRCVLKMDHHCPWLATCVGLRNYKPFLLFLIYTSLFCWVCFIYAGRWMWAEMLDNVQLDEGMKVVNTILLAVLGGIIGLVLSGFTGWHIYLTMTGQTTIESLEKTRYLTALQKSLESQPRRGRTYLADEPDPQSALHSLGDQLKQIHANALPGVLRPEEGESNNESRSNSTGASPSPAQDHLRRSYASLEAQRDWDRYSAYLDEKDSERLPNAFNVGWKRNLVQVMGRQPWFWGLPVLNSCGDGWQWDISQEWQDARDRLARERAQRGSQQNSNRSFQGPTGRIPTGPNWRWQAGQGFVPRDASGPQTHVDVELSDAHSVPMQTVSGQRPIESSASHPSNGKASDPPRAESTAATANWNDVPEDFIRPASSNSHITRGRSTAPSGKGKGD